MYSEKARIPAWTDRILRKGPNLRQIDYNVAQQLRFSDHRPVYATFQCMVSIVDEAIREALSHEIYEARRSDVGSSTATRQVVDSDDEDLIGYDSIEPGLPPASSDKRKWWLDNGKPARSDIKPPQDGAVPNPGRPSNPFSPSEESDWVTVPRMPRHRTPSQSAPSFTSPPNSRPTNGPRKLPPPYNPSVASLENSFSQASLQEAPAPPDRSGVTSPSDRRPSTSSTTSKKSGPPVGRKPVHLTSSPTLSTGSKTPLLRSPQPSFQKSPQSTGNSSVFPPPPRRGTATSPAMGGDSEYRRANNSPPLPPQPRRPIANGAGANGKAGLAIDQKPRPGLPPRPIRDLLGDDDDELSGWEALKPT